MYLRLESCVLFIAQVRTPASYHIYVRMNYSEGQRLKQRKNFNVLPFDMALPVPTA